MHKSHAPVINPFDKLTQNQFDSYVSNIQSKIQLALNPTSPEPQHVSRSIAEISRSTIASPAPSPAPLSKRPSLEPRAPLKTTYTPVGAGTPNEPYELSDDDDEDNDEVESKAKPPSWSGSEDEAEAEPEPLSAIPEGTEEDEMAEDAGTDEADYSGYENENENDPEEVAWDYSGEDASEDEEQSAAGEAEEEGAEEEEDTFIGKGKGRHPAEGPGLAGLLNGSGAQRTGRTAQTPERAGRSSRALEDSFEEGVGRMPILGPTSTPFISRLRSGSPHSPDGSEDDEESPPWEVGQGLSVPEIAENPGNESEEYESEEESADEKNGPGAAREDAIEVLDSDEEAEAIKAPNEEQVDEIAPSPARSNGSDRPHVVISHQEFDELQFDDSAAYLDEHEPDSLLDDTMDGDDSVRLQVLAGHLFPPRPSSLFSASSAAATREPSQSKDAEELDQSAETVQAPEYSVEEPDTSTLPADREPEPDQPSIQQSMDYSDFIGENSLLAQQDTSLTQAEQHFQEVTVYELENGSRYYDYDGVRHFLNSEGEVYETIAIPPPRPTIQQPPELSMIEEVTEYDITRRLGGADDDNGDGGAKFDFLKEFDDTFSSVGEPILHYPGEDNSVAFGIDDIPERPGAALGFRSRDLPGADASAFLSDSAILRDDLGEYDTGEHHGVLGQLGATTSMTGTVESMGGRNSGDLISDDGLISASEAGGDGDADDSQDSILDDDGDTTRELNSGLLNREDLATPVPPGNPDESGTEGPLQLNEKDVADALAAVAQLAENASFEEFMSAGGEVEAPSVNDVIFDAAPNLDNLMNEVSTMSAEEEDILARSFNMTDALQNAPLPLTDLPAFDNTATRLAESVVEGSVSNESDPFAFVTTGDTPEKLASDVLAEVFEGVEAVPLPSVVGTRAVTPSGEPPEPRAHIEEIEIRSRSSTPKQPRPALAETENQDPSPRRTPPTPTLSAGQSLTAPELSIATSISGRSGVVPNVSVYEGSPTSSPHPEDPIPAIPPAEPDTTQLPDPNLPPSPTHLSMPAVPTAPGASEARREVSPSVVVEPPTPHARSEDGTVGADPTIKPPEEETHAPTDESETNEGSRPVVVKDAEVDEEVDVVGPLSQGANTPSRRSRTRSPSARSSTKESSGSRTTPTPGEKIRAGDKRKRLEDPPSPASTPLKLSLKSPARSNGPVKSPLSDANPSPNTPTPRGNRALFKRTPNSKPASTASGSSSRKVSGSDTAPAPWPMRHRTHRHTSATVTSPERLRANTSRGSPAPRSNCRFHKVTIPADDKSAGKIEFIIPACALGRPKVLEEHGAEDCGLLAPEEEGSMVTDLGDIEPGAIDKLKAIVGTTLFDENVCGYLPKSPATTSHPAPNRLKGSLRGSISSLKFEPTSEGESKAAPIQAKPKPRSRPSILHDDQPYKPPAEDNDSDDPTEEERTRKRPKLKKRETTGPTSTVKFPSLGQDSPEKPAHPIGPGEARIPISRRMKRARRPADAQPYKPEPDQGESSPDDDVKSKPRKRIKHRAASATRRTNSGTTLQESKRQEDEDENPFKPKHELKRVLSPEAINGGTQGQSTSSVLDSKPTRAEQKELEQHIELGDHPGEVVDEEGSPVNVEQLSEPAPAKVAAYVDRGAPSEIGKKEANGAGENALGAIGASKKGWSKYLRF
ncbi:hypothetical protein FS749_010034 [Ceratobasidium sp. UAMH 11750]|nr:hypothetical protein FS749_010034 [Ceratobasidium sp. UAMH 11750]